MIFAIYFPAIMAGVISIPIVLIGRLYGSTLSGFGAACLTVLGSSYFSRSMAGYLDTDLFATLLPAFIIYFILYHDKKESKLALFMASLTVTLFPYFYSSGVPIATAMVISYIALLWLRFLLRKEPYKDDQLSSLHASSVVLSVSAALSPMSSALLFNGQYGLLIAVIINTTIFLICKGGIKETQFFPLKISRYAAAVAVVFLLLFSQSTRSIWLKAAPYFKKQAITESGVSGRMNQSSGTISLNYKNVYETIVEAKKTPWKMVMERISGHTFSFAAAILGLIIFVYLNPEFLVAIPLVAIGVIAHWAGHRFTVHAVPIAAIGLTFLPLSLLELYRRYPLGKNAPESINIPSNHQQYCKQYGKQWFFGITGARAAVILIVVCAIIPNYTTAINKTKTLPTVLDTHKVQLLKELESDSTRGDYVHSWWDWGTAVWFHAQRNVLTTPNNQSNDTFIFAKMMMTDSPRLAAHLGRTSAEYFHHGGPDGSRGVAVQHLFKNRTGTPEEALAELEKSLPVLPTRGVYLYLPTDLLRFYHVLHMFGERDLMTGQESQPDNWFYFQTMRYAGPNRELVWLEHCPYAPGFRMLAEPRQGVLCDVEKRVTLQQLLTLRRSGKSLQSLGWSHDAVSLQIKNGPLVHGTKINLNDEKVHLELLNGQAAETQMDRVEWVCPTYLMKSAERSDTQQTFFESTNGNNSGLRLILSHTPPFAMVVDEPAYRTQLIQLLGRGQGDPEYFEPITTNQGGRVFKLKK